ncbi:MAG: TRAP transporter substrate-binding protein [Deltaproteobacteria bacterium]|nr:TRAP transporter substrate-binding protein [Deltaproteobacteria bacterium]
MKKITFLTFLIFCFSTMVAFTATAKTQLTYANFFPPTHIQSQLAQSWCDEVKKRTNGEIVIQYFPAQALAKAPQTYDAVVNGIADIGLTVLAYSRGRFPVASAIDLPLGYKNGVQATRIANAVLNKFHPEEFNDTKVMYLHAHGPGLINTVNKKVASLEDMKGMKIRTTGASGRVIKALGGSPVGKGMNECYQMLQKGVVDGSLHPMESNKGWKLGEVVKYVTESYPIAYTTTFAVFMNKAKWNKLTPAQQKTIMEINAEWADKHGEGWDSSDKAGLEFFKSKGGEFVSLSDAEVAKWKAAVAPIMDEYAEKVNKKGIDGKAVVNFIKANM